jgi:hypothetical protein
MDIARLNLSVGVNEHRPARPAERLGEFRSELVAGDNLGVMAGERLGKQAASVPAEPVIAPQGVPVADDKSSGYWIVDSG